MAAGGLLMDSAQYSSVEELLVLAKDRKGWQAGVHALLPAQERKKGRKHDDSQGCMVNNVKASAILQVSLHEPSLRIRKDQKAKALK